MNYHHHPTTFIITSTTTQVQPNTIQRNTSSNLKDIDSLDKGKGNLHIIIDSNRKFTNFKELLAGEFSNELTPIVIPCRNITKTESISNFTQIITPRIILLHIGINNLDDQRPKDIALELKELAESFQNKFNSNTMGGPLSKLCP